MLLDMFAAPVQPTNNNFLNGRHVSGRINLNSSILVPFTNMLVGTDLRLSPLRSVFLGTTNLSVSTDEAAWRVGMANFVNSNSYGATNYCQSIGRLAEVSGIGSANKSDENLLRQIIDQVTVQGNVFRVHAIGQALKQTTSGRVLVQAERSLEAIMERDDNGNFHIVYWRTIPL